MRKKFEYNIDEDRYYPYFEITEIKTQRGVSFHTNPSLEGMFIKDNGSYNQALGTTQFSMPFGIEKQKRELRTLFYEKYKDWPEPDSY